MKKFILLVIPIIMTISILPASAQMGTPNWNFKNRQQVQSAVKNNLNDLRASYDIIISARRQGYIRSAVQVYERESAKGAYLISPKLCASYAFAHHVMTAPLRWDAKDDLKPIPVGGNEIAPRVTLYRDRALKELPNSPEVLLSYALYLNTQIGQRARALKLIERALRHAPKWADLHFWHAKQIDYTWVDLPEKSRDKLAVSYARRQLQAIQKAERLDPVFVKECLIDRVHVYDRLKMHKEALAAFDAYTRYKPHWMKFRPVPKWRQLLVDKASA